MSHRNDDEKDPLDFSQYIPWKDNSEEEETENGELPNSWRFVESMFDGIDPERVVTMMGDDEIKVKHIKTALNNLKKETGGNGPYTQDQIMEQINLALVEDYLQQLVKEGFVIKDGDKYSLTELGRKQVDKMTKDARHGLWE